MTQQDKGPLARLCNVHGERAGLNLTMSNRDFAHEGEAFLSWMNGLGSRRPQFRGSEKASGSGSRQKSIQFHKWTQVQL